MATHMTERTRLVVDTNEAVRLAVKLAAAKQFTSTSELVTALLEKALPSEMAEARKHLAKHKKGGEE